MGSYLSVEMNQENAKANNSSEKARERWRMLYRIVIKNSQRRFHHRPDRFNFMEKFEERWRKDFDVQPKHLSAEASTNWRKAVGRVVKNPSRRFRFVVDLAKRAEAENKKQQIQGEVGLKFGEAVKVISMGSYLSVEMNQENAKANNSSEKAREREAASIKRKLQEKIDVALYVQKAALQFINAGSDPPREIVYRRGPGCKPKSH